MAAPGCKMKDSLVKSLRMGYPRAGLGFKGGEGLGTGAGGGVG